MMYSNASQREWTVEQRWEGDMDQNLLYWARKVGRWRGWWICWVGRGKEEGKVSDT